MIHIIRANHANQFELQNYIGIKNVEVITSLHPLSNISLKTKKMWSPTDLPNLPFRRQILNRVIGGEQWLLGLEKYLTERFDDSNLPAQTGHRSTIVHTAETYSPYTHQVVKLRQVGVIDKLICTCWETIPHNNEKFARLRSWKKEAYKYVDIFQTPTQLAKKALVAEGVDPSKIKVIPYGVDLTRFHARDLSGVSRKVRVLTVARLEREKGMEYLEQVAQAFPDTQFVVIGRGSYRPVGKNIEIKQVPYDKIHEEYQSADIFFLPSHSTPTWEEQYGFALVEAMACGVPIVSTLSGAISEVVGPAGILVKDGDVNAMIDSLGNLISDQSLQKSLSKAGLVRAKSLYDAKIVSQKLISLYL